MTALLRSGRFPAVALLLSLSLSKAGAAPSSSTTNGYGDETGFRERSRGLIERIAAKPYGERSLAPSTCPDTGLPVRVCCSTPPMSAPGPSS